MTIYENLEYGIIEETGEKLFKYRLTVNHFISKWLRQSNCNGNNWLCKTYEAAIDLYNYNVEIALSVYKKSLK